MSSCPCSPAQVGGWGVLSALSCRCGWCAEGATFSGGKSPNGEASGASAASASGTTASSASGASASAPPMVGPICSTSLNFFEVLLRGDLLTLRDDLLSLRTDLLTLRTDLLSLRTDLLSLRTDLLSLRVDLLNLIKDLLNLIKDLIKEKFLFINNDDLLGGILKPGDGSGDPSGITQLLAKAARAEGAKIFEDSPVEDILVKNKRIEGVVVNGEKIECEYIVLATGMWSRQIGEKLGVSIPLYPAEHFFVITEPIY